MQTSIFAGATISLLAYMFGAWLKKKFHSGFFNPLLISIAVTIIVLLAAHVDYDTYNMGAKYISWFLTPATVCLAIPLYEQLTLFGLNQQEFVTFLPKSITTAIGMSVSEELGGYVNITVLVIVVTGVLGNILAEPVLKLFRIQEPIAKGLALGSSAHAIGTAKAMELGEIEGAMSSLSIAVAGILTVFGASVFSWIYSVL